MINNLLRTVAALGLFAVISPLSADVATAASRVVEPGEVTRSCTPPESSNPHVSKSSNGYSKVNYRICLETRVNEDGQRQARAAYVFDSFYYWGLGWYKDHKARVSASFQFTLNGITFGNAGILNVEGSHIADRTTWQYVPRAGQVELGLENGQKWGGYWHSTDVDDLDRAVVPLRGVVAHHHMD